MGTWRLRVKTVCVPCRNVVKAHLDKCQICGGDVTIRDYRWRAPRKSNDSAWRLIESGEWLWERGKPKAEESYGERERRANKKWQGSKLWPDDMDPDTKSTLRIRSMFRRYN